MSEKPTDKDKNIAESFSLDLAKVTSIEFPGNVINTSRAIDMLGSRPIVAKAFASRGDKQLELRFRPNDPYEHPIISNSSKAQNIVLKISVSKKLLDQAGGDVQKAINLSKEGSKFEPKYIVETNYRFRELSDFQYNTRNSRFVKKVKNSLLSGNYEAIKEFNFDLNERTDNFQDLDIPPPPRFSPVPYHFNYQYRQNPSLVSIDDGKGGQKLINRNRPIMLHAQYISWDEDPPIEPAKELQKLTDPKAIACYELLEKMFEERPIWTRIAIQHHIPREYHVYLKHVIHYLSYTIQNGPWRSSVVKFGLDTRSSSEYRIYQTRRFRHNLKHTEDTEDTGLSYVFDGVNVIGGSVVQFCDITDPDIRKVIDKGSIRETIDKEAGWYEDLDYQRIKVLLYLKYKAIMDKTPLDKSQVNSIINGVPPPIVGVNRLQTNRQQAQDKNMQLSADRGTDSEDNEEDEDVAVDVDEVSKSTGPSDELLNHIIPVSKDNVDILRDLSGLVSSNDLFGVELGKTAEKQSTGNEDDDLDN